MWLQKFTPWDSLRHASPYDAPPLVERPHLAPRRRTRVADDSDSSSSDLDPLAIRDHPQQAHLDTFCYSYRGSGRSDGYKMDVGMYFDSDVESEGNKRASDGDSDDVSHRESRAAHSDDGADNEGHSDDAGADNDKHTERGEGDNNDEDVGEHQAGTEVRKLAHGTVSASSSTSPPEPMREVGTSGVFPDELLAYVFTFVRGPPASGSLHPARLVCRRWRAVIDSSLALQKPREPYISSYRLGYLSPTGLMPAPTARELFPLLETLITSAATNNHARIFIWARDVLVPKLRLTKTQRASLTTKLQDIRLVLASGAWKRDTFTAQQLKENIDVVHYRDLDRVMIILPREDSTLVRQRKEAIYQNWKDPAQCEDWTDREIRNVLLIPFKAEYCSWVIEGWPWMVRRGLIDEPTARDWLILRLEANVRDMKLARSRGTLELEIDETRDPVADLILDDIERRGLSRAINRDTVLTAATGKFWPSLRRVVQLCPVEELRCSWQPNRRLNYLENWYLTRPSVIEDSENGPILHYLGAPPPHPVRRQTLGGEFVSKLAGVSRPALDWLLAHGVWRGISTTEANALLRVAGKENPGIFDWLLDNLPAPTSGLILLDAVEDPPSDGPLNSKLVNRLERRLPWDPLLMILKSKVLTFLSIAARIRLYRHGNNKVMEACHAAGYRIPLVIDRFERHAVHVVHLCEGWLELFEWAAAHGQPLSSFTFTTSFFVGAARFKEGRKFVARLMHKGVPISDEVRRLLCHAELGASAVAAAGGTPSRHNRKGRKHDAALIDSVEEIVAWKLEPTTAVLCDFAAIYRTRVHQSRGLNVYAGIGLARITVTPSDMAPMQCLVRLAAAFPACAATATGVTEILAEVGIASVVAAHRAGYPIDAVRLEEVFAARGNAAGVTWARQASVVGFEKSIVDVNCRVDVVDIV